MALTISPAVCRARAQRTLSQGLFLAGLFAGALSTYMLLRGLLHEELRLQGYGLVAVVIAASSWGGLRDLGFRIPVPYIPRQVPEWFRGLLPLPATALSFGFLLGMGFATKFTHGAHMTFMVVLATTVDPLDAAVALFAYSLFRAITTFVDSESPGSLAAGLQELSRATSVLSSASIGSSISLALTVFATTVQ